MTDEEGISIPDGNYITLTEAARMHGYSVPKGGSGNLRKAAQEGRLRTIRVNDRLRLTTREWMQEYMDALKTNKGGRPRKQPRPDA